MGIELKTDLKEKTLGSIQGTADKAYQELQAKKAEYEASMKQLDVFTAWKNKALSAFKSAQQNCPTQDSSEFLNAQAKYNSAMKGYSEAEMMSDIKRSSLNNSIFYSGKMNSSAILASSILD